MRFVRLLMWSLMSALVDLSLVASRRLFSRVRSHLSWLRRRARALVWACASLGGCQALGSWLKTVLGDEAGVCFVGFVTTQLHRSEVFDGARINEADFGEVFVKLYGDVVAVGAGGFETGLNGHFSAAVLGEPVDELFDSYGGISK